LQGFAYSARATGFLFSALPTIAGHCIRVRVKLGSGVRGLRVAGTFSNTSTPTLLYPIHRSSWKEGSWKVEEELVHSGEVSGMSLAKAIEPSPRQDGVSAPTVFGTWFPPHQPLTLEAADQAGHPAKSEEHAVGELARPHSVLRSPPGVEQYLVGG
jgi:hypothetical protein